MSRVFPLGPTVLISFRALLLTLSIPLAKFRLENRLASHSFSCSFKCVLSQTFTENLMGLGLRLDARDTKMEAAWSLPSRSLQSREGSSQTPGTMTQGSNRGKERGTRCIGDPRRSS
jgi:hypothetical protein